MLHLVTLLVHKLKVTLYCAGFIGNQILKTNNHTALALRNISCGFDSVSFLKNGCWSAAEISNVSMPNMLEQEMLKKVTA